MLHLVLAAMIAAPETNSHAATAPPPMKCETGPITRKFGDTDWVVYSCEDQRSLVFVSTPGSRASEFYFILFPKNGKYQLYGEGNGDKRASDAAGDEISRVPEEGVAALIEATRAAPDGH